MILFYIYYKHERDDMGLFVSASTRAEAIQIWRVWCNDVFDLADDENDGPQHVFLVPKLGDVPSHHSWHVPHHGVECVSDTTKFDELEVIAHALNYGITSYKQ